MHSWTLDVRKRVHFPLPCVVCSALLVDIGFVGHLVSCRRERERERKMWDAIFLTALAFELLLHVRRAVACLHITTKPQFCVAVVQCFSSLGFKFFCSTRCGQLAPTIFHQLSSYWCTNALLCNKSVLVKFSHSLVESINVIWKYHRVYSR